MALDPTKIISADDYLNLAEAYANIRSHLNATQSYFWDCVETIVEFDEVQPTLDLLGIFNATYTLGTNTFADNTLFLNAVKALNNHVLLRSGGTYDSIDAFLDANDITVPSEWASMSAVAGYPIDDLYVG